MGSLNGRKFGGKVTGRTVGSRRIRGNRIEHKAPAARALHDEVNATRQVVAVQVAAQDRAVEAGNEAMDRSVRAQTEVLERPRIGHPRGNANNG